MITVRNFKKPDDYELLKTWWEHWKHPIASIDELNDTGFMACYDGKPLCCGFLILTNAKFALIETVAASPETNYEDRLSLLTKLNEHCESLAKALGYRRIVAYMDKKRLAEKAEVNGYKIWPHQAFIGAKEL